MLPSFNGSNRKLLNLVNSFGSISRGALSIYKLAFDLFSRASIGQQLNADIVLSEISKLMQVDDEARNYVSMMLIQVRANELFVTSSMSFNDAMDKARDEVRSVLDTLEGRIHLGSYLLRARPIVEKLVEELGAIAADVSLNGEDRPQNEQEVINAVYDKLVAATVDLGMAA